MESDGFELKRRRGLLFILSGPSGTGKGTLARMLLESVPGLCFSVSATTREPRPGEVNGVDYLFLDVNTFKSMIENGEFLEWSIFDNHYYGTPRAPVEKWLGEGRDVLLDIEVYGAAQVRKVFPDGILVFLLPPSWGELRKRLSARGAWDSAGVERRLKTAVEQLEHVNMYDYVVLNDKLDEALDMLCSIVKAERCRYSRQELELPALWGPIGGDEA